MITAVSQLRTWIVKMSADAAALWKDVINPKKASGDTLEIDLPCQ